MILTEAWLTLSWIDFVISFLPYRWWKSWLLNQPEAETNQITPLGHLVWSVNAAANHHPAKPTCLRRSLTLKHMLKRRKTPVSLRIGIRKTGTQVDAHAWIEHAGSVVNDSPNITTQYSQFPTLKEQLVRQL